MPVFSTNWQLLAQCYARHFCKGLCLDRGSAVCPTHACVFRDRDLALVGVLAYTFARIDAVMNLKVKDYYPSGKRYLLRFKEKGGKGKELPVHHELEEILDPIP